MKLREAVPWLDLQGEEADLNMSSEGLGSVIHEDGDPEPPSDRSCKETEDSIKL